MADLNKTVAIIFDATDLTSDKLAKIQGGLQGLVKDTDDAGASAEKAGKQIDSMGTGGEASVLTLANAMKTLAASFVVQEFLEANTEAQKLEATFTVLTGSSAAAAAELEYIRGVADKLGVNANDLASSFGKFSAATQGSSIAGEGAREIFEAFAGTMATLGSSTEDISGAMVQLSQGVSKGRFELEDLKSIAERVPGFFNTMAEAVGVSTEQLFKMVSQGEITGEVMVQVADKLKEKYGDVEYVDTFAASWNRLGNALDEAYVTIGESGVMTALEKGVEGVTLALVGSVAGFEMLGKTLGNIAYLVTTMDWEGFVANKDTIENEYVAAVEKARNAFLGLNQEVEKSGTTGQEAGEKIEQGLLSGELSAKALKEASKQVEESLKALGIDPKTVSGPIEAAAAEIQGIISDLVNNPSTKPEAMFTAMIAAIDKVANAELPALNAAAQGAFEDGRLSAEQYDIVLDAIASKAEGSWPQALDKTAAAVKKQADESEKAKEAANKYALELEKLASNEKIALIESKVKLDIAEVEANAQIAAATLDALASNYASATSLIGDLLSGLTDNANTAADQLKIGFAKEFAAQASEMHAAEMAFIAAQIDYYQMKTSLMAQGNPVVTIQGDGLAPHLEAIMWEVLKQIQVKMAIDGGDMLVGGIQ